MAQNYVLSIWSNVTSAFEAANAGAALPGGQTSYYLMLYFVLGLVSVVIVLVRSAVLVVGSIAASRKLHRELLSKLIRLPMSFFDAQPTGGRRRREMRGARTPPRACARAQGLRGVKPCA